MQNLTVMTVKCENVQNLENPRWYWTIPPSWKRPIATLVKCHQILTKFCKLKQSRALRKKSAITHSYTFKFKMADGRHIGKHLFRSELGGGRAQCPIFAKFCEADNNQGEMPQIKHFWNSKWRTTAILKIVTSPYFSET